MPTVLEPFASSLLQLSILVPLLVWALRGNRPANSRPLAFFAVVFLVTELLTAYLANVSLFAGQHWNWAGKGAALAAGLAFAFLLPGFRPRDFGVAAPRFAGAGPIVAICAVYFAVRLALGWRFAGTAAGVDLETCLFQATLPGLAEELAFRGLLLGLLNRLFAPRWTLAGVTFGWGAIVTNVLFGLVHGLSFQGGQPAVNAFAALRTAFDGMLFALLAERTRSVFPSMVLHNALDLIGNH